MADKDESIPPSGSSDSKETSKETAESSSGSGKRLPNLYNRFVQSFENALSQLTGMSLFD
jgi:hypothetical protein